MTTTNSFGARAPLKAAGGTFDIFRLDALERRGLPVARLPYSLRILLENLLRREDGRTVTPAEIERLARWDPTKTPDDEIAFMPARVLMQDFTGVPAVMDFAALRDAMQGMGGDPKQVNPLLPAELVIDHSVIVDEFGTPTAFQVNADLEFQRNRQRYALLRWAQRTFQGFRVVPPDTGIVHQVNLEYLARVVFTTEGPLQDAKSPSRQGSMPQAYPDTLVGTDSHTTMINGLGVLGWGVGGIEAEAAMLGQPVSMLIPQVVGFRLTGKLSEGATAPDLVLTVTEMLRKKGVVGKFVEFYGPGIATLPLADRATIGNMAPEYGATVGIFPVDQETLRYLEFTGRPKEQVQLVEAYMKEQGLFHSGTTTEPVYSDTLSLDLSTVEPSLAGPRRPQDRVSLRDLPRNFQLALPALVKPSSPIAPAVNSGRWEAEGGHVATAVETPPRHRTHVDLQLDGVDCKLRHGSVVIAAITSCTNTSNPSVMIAAGLVAKKAVEKGLKSQPWVKTSLAPGSKVVTDYLQRAGLMPYLEQLRFHLVRQGSGRCGPLVHQVGDVPQAVRRGLYGGRALARASGSRGRSVRLGAEFDLHPPAAVLRRHAANAGPGHGHPGGAGAVPLGRQHHHGPHLARRVHPQDQPCRPTPDRPRGKARGLQLLRRSPRQPRGDGARHVRQRTTQEPARAGDGGAGHAAPPRRRADDDLRCLGEVPGRGRAAHRDRGKGVRLRLVARLGGERPPAARCASGDSPELRADPPVEPGGDGNPPAAVPPQRDAGEARPDRKRSVRDHGARRRAHRGIPARQGAGGQGDAAGRLGCAVHGNRPHRHAAGAAVLPPRRNPRVRAAAAACAKCEALTGLLDPSRVRPMNLETSMRCPALVCNRRWAAP